MSCLAPIRLVNPRYKKLSEGFPKEFASAPDFFIKVPCGKCPECMKRRAHEWRVRLIMEERFGNHRTAAFCTLTIAPSAMFRMNSNPSPYIRRFLDLLRKKTPNKCIPFHWLVAEYGDKKGRLHFHGIFWDLPCTYKVAAKCWKYGFAKFEGLRGQSGLSYVTKYLTKQQKIIGKYTARVWCSPGLGRSYLDSSKSNSHRSTASLKRVCYVDNYKYPLPQYFYRKLFTDLERRVETCKNLFKVNRLSFNDLLRQKRDVELARTRWHFAPPRKSWNDGLLAVTNYLKMFENYGFYSEDSQEY